MYEELDALVAEAKAAGVDPDHAAEVLDGLIDFRLIAPGPVGVVLEVVDRAAFRAVLTGAGKAIRKLISPEARAKAKARRAKRREKRAKK